jgi:hypothetical protein
MLRTLVPVVGPSSYPFRWILSKPPLDTSKIYTEWFDEHELIAAIPSNPWKVSQPELNKMSKLLVTGRGGRLPVRYKYPVDAFASYRTACNTSFSKNVNAAFRAIGLHRMYALLDGVNFFPSILDALTLGEYAGLHEQVVDRLSASPKLPTLVAASLHVDVKIAKDLFKTAYQQQAFGTWCNKHSIIATREPDIVKRYRAACLAASKHLVSLFPEVVSFCQNVKHPKGDVHLIRRSATYFIFGSCWLSPSGEH